MDIDKDVMIETLRNEILKKDKAIDELSFRLYETLEELNKYKNLGGTIDENYH